MMACLQVMTVRTTFDKVRLDERTLQVYTSDYTFATTDSAENNQLCAPGCHIAASGFSVTDSESTPHPKHRSPFSKYE